MFEEKATKKRDTCSKSTSISWKAILFRRNFWGDPAEFAQGMPHLPLLFLGPPAERLELGTNFSQDVYFSRVPTLPPTKLGEKGHLAGGHRFSSKSSKRQAHLKLQRWNSACTGAYHTYTEHIIHVRAFLRCFGPSWLVLPGPLAAVLGPGQGVRHRHSPGVPRKATEPNVGTQRP